MRKIYEITGKYENNVSVIKILSGEFEGIEYTYGAVAVEENKDKTSAALKFEYTIVSGAVGSRVESFRLLTGDILTSIIENQISSESIIYKGGADE